MIINRLVLNCTTKKGSWERYFLKEISIYRKIIRKKNKNNVISESGYQLIDASSKDVLKDKSAILKMIPDLSLVTWCHKKHINDIFFPIHFPNYIFLELVVKNVVIRFGN